MAAAYLLDKAMDWLWRGRVLSLLPFCLKIQEALWGFKKRWGFFVVIFYFTDTKHESVSLILFLLCSPFWLCPVPLFLDAGLG